MPRYSLLKDKKHIATRLTLRQIWIVAYEMGVVNFGVVAVLLHKGYEIKLVEVKDA